MCRLNKPQQKYEKNGSKELNYNQKMIIKKFKCESECCQRNKIKKEKHNEKYYKENLELYIKFRRFETIRNCSHH